MYITNVLCIYFNIFRFLWNIIAFMELPFLTFLSRKIQNNLDIDLILSSIQILSMLFYKVYLI